jgi:hypothetical protein
MVSTFALWLTLAQTRYLFELDGVSVGTVELQLVEGRYSYTSRHAYRRARAEHTETFASGSKGPLPEGLWLWHRPEAGCVDGIAEFTHLLGRLCAEQRTAREVSGTTLGKPFTARYDAHGELEELKVGKSRFVRSDAPYSPGQPYAAGFSITGQGKALQLEPPVSGARWLSVTPRGTRSGPLAEADSCLEVAQQFVAQNPDHTLVLGLVVEKGKAYPHAWAASERGDVDPSAKLDGAQRPNVAYLELPRADAGRLYLELLEGRRRLVWR